MNTRLSRASRLERKIVAGGRVGLLSLVTGELVGLGKVVDRDDESVTVREDGKGDEALLTAPLSGVVILWDPPSEEDVLRVRHKLGDGMMDGFDDGAEGDGDEEDATGVH